MKGSVRREAVTQNKTWGMKLLYFSTSPVIYVPGSPAGWLTHAHKLHSTTYSHWSEWNCIQQTLFHQQHIIHAIHVRNTHLHEIPMFFNAYKAMPSKSPSIHSFVHSVIDLWLYTWFGVECITLCVIDVGEFLVASHELLSAALSRQVTFFKHLLDLWNSNQSIQELRHRLSPSTTEKQTHTQVPRSFIEKNKFNTMKLHRKK